MHCLTSVIATAIVLILAIPGVGAVPAVVLRPPDLWSFQVESRRLLADLGYHTEYAFEFYDEEEIHVRATSDRAEIVEGVFRTILDGDPAYAQLQVRGEEMPLWVVLNPGSEQAAWMTAAGLRAADLPDAELQRRIGMLASLMNEARLRLGLRNFRPSVAPVVRMEVAQVDVLTLVPGTGSIVRYEVRLPGTSGTMETLVVQVRDQTWTIGWAGQILTVTIEAPGRRPVTRTYQLPGTRRDATATQAIALLRGARERFGTGPVVPPLP